MDRYGSDIMQPVERGEDKARNCARRLASTGKGKVGRHGQKWKRQELLFSILVLFFSKTRNCLLDPHVGS